MLLLVRQGVVQSMLMHVKVLLCVIKVCEKLLNDAPPVATGHTEMCKECSDACDYAVACDQGM